MKLGYAYLEPDMGCPFVPCNTLDSYWRLNGTQEEIFDAATECKIVNEIMKDVRIQV